MPLSNDYILKTFHFKDENIYFDDIVKEEVIKGITSLIYHASLTYIPKFCPKCGCVYDKHIIEKHGFKTSTITLLKVSNMNAYLKLRKQRYICHNCHHTFTVDTSIVNKRCYISNNTKLAVALAARNKISECDIAKEYNVSHSTVNRVINSYYEIIKPNFNYLPEYLCFDEFKSVKSCDGAMSFLFCDAQTGKIINIIEDRRLKSLLDYFKNYSIEARKNVKLIVIDMYKPYIQLIKALFPKAKIVIDKFHIIQLISRALNKTRVNIMNQDKKNYNKLKHYWKLILKDRSKLDIINYHYYTCFKQMMCEEDVVNYLLELSKELKDTYELYQDLLHSIKNKNIDQFEYILDNVEKEYPNISKYMKTSIKSIREYKAYIINLMYTDYNNGVIEGINNKIKVIKRIAFGYRSFIHFKLRILICNGTGIIEKGLSNSA
jgi:transposase